MDKENKREIARKLFPHLAWELSGIEIREIRSVDKNTSTTVGRKMEIEDVITKIKSLEYNNEDYTIAIIPIKKIKLAQKL